MQAINKCPIALPCFRYQEIAAEEYVEKTNSLQPTDADSPASDVQAPEETSRTGSPWNKCDERKDENEGTSPRSVHPPPSHDAQSSVGQALWIVVLVC